MRDAKHGAVPVQAQRLFEHLTGLQLHVQRQSLPCCPCLARQPNGKATHGCLQCSASKWMQSRSLQIRQFSGRCGSANGVVLLPCERNSICLVVQDRDARGQPLTKTTVKLIELVASLLIRNSQEHASVSKNNAAPSAGEAGNHLVRAMLAYTREHFQGPMSLADVADAMGRNANYLAHVFATSMKVPFHRYLEDMRMAEARRMLQNGMLTVEEIASSLGFSSADCFRQAFKRRTGLSPLIWSNHQARQAHQVQIQPNL